MNDAIDERSPGFESNLTFNLMKMTRYGIQI